MTSEEILQDILSKLTPRMIIQGASRDNEKPMGYLLTYIRDMYGLPKTQGWDIAEAVLKHYNIENKEYHSIFENTTMKRQKAIKMNESQLQRVISENIAKVLNEDFSYGRNVWDVLDELKQTMSADDILARLISRIGEYAAIKYLEDIKSVEVGDDDTLSEIEEAEWGSKDSKPLPDVSDSTISDTLYQWRMKHGPHGYPSPKLDITKS